MNKKEIIRSQLEHKLEDSVILEEMIAINLLPFVRKTLNACSGHCDQSGFLYPQYPYFTIQYSSNENPAQEFHKSLQEIGIEIEGRWYSLRALDMRYDYLVSFSMDSQRDFLIGPEVKNIPAKDSIISYQFIIPPGSYFQHMRNRNVRILEEFWGEVSKFLSSISSPGIYSERVFVHQMNIDGTINSPFRKK